MPTIALLPLAFVNAWFFSAGIGLASIPIIIHLLNRRRFKVIRWAAMEYLLQAMRKNRRRLRFEQWILLAVRCLLLFLLGLALARPTGCNQSSLARLAGQHSALHVMVIDNGLSMSYEADRPGAKTHLDQAKKVAKQLLERIEAKGGNEAVVIITTAGGAPDSSTPEAEKKSDGQGAGYVIQKPSYDLFAARAAIDRIEQSYGRKDIAGALQLANKVGEDENKQPNKNLYLFSDSAQAGLGEKNPQADAIRVAAAALTKHFRQPINMFNLGGAAQWAYTVADARPETPLVSTAQPTNLLADLVSHGQGSQAQLIWKVDDKPIKGGGTLNWEMVKGTSFDNDVTFTEGGPHVISATLVDDQRLKEGQTRYRVVDVASKLPVLVVEGERGVGALEGSGAFFATALTPDATSKTSYIAPDLISDIELGNRVFNDFRAVVLANVAQIAEKDADRLQKFVKDGGTLLIFMGDQVNGDAYNRLLLPRQLMPGKLIARKTDTGVDAKGFTFDFNPEGNTHRLLNIFKSGGHYGLDTTRIYTYYQCDLPPDSKAERVLDYLAADNGKSGGPKDPAITLDYLGRGRVVFVSTSADAKWTTFPAKPAYLALMQSLMAGTVNVGDAWMNLQVGQPLEVPASLRLSSPPVLTNPLKKPVDVESVVNADGETGYRSKPLNKPGLYTLKAGNKIYPIAVNILPDEADVRTLKEPQVKKALGDIDLAFLGDSLPFDVLSRNDNNDIGWFLMFAVLILVGLECWMAMRFGHYRKHLVAPAAKGASANASPPAATPALATATAAA